MIDKISDNKRSKPKKHHFQSDVKLVRKKKQRVICAMSGGVDSSVVAALLKKQGFDVIGIFMKLWAEDSDALSSPKENVCCSLEAATAARAVAQKLDIPFYVVNFAEEFKKMVVDYYIKEYENGRTPNPCVICNRDIKGEILFKKVLELEGDFLATGHYARIMQKSPLGMHVKNQNDKSKSQNDQNEYHLYRGKDTNKDQTYFLWTLTQEKLAKILFPVGHLTKPEVRKLALKLGLPTAQRRESQGICFIPDRNVSGFLRRHAKKLIQPGPIINITGKKIGIHEGLINYTIGQRERLNIGGSKAYYVVKLDSQKNTLVVGDDVDLFRKSLMAKDINWITDGILQTKEKSITATIRYRHLSVSCHVEDISQNKLKVVFDKPQRAITPGQSIVFYKGDELLGGGVIDEACN